jgi:TetR/AcrR family transcriptional regulator, lmrAB and yxaGH operons repressor
MSDLHADKPEHGTKTLMIRAAADLMQRKGFTGTGVAEILSLSKAPRGSLYYHFPGGKREIVLEAIAYTRRLFSRDLTAVAHNSSSLEDYWTALGALSKRDLLATDFDASCPIAATALDVFVEERDILQACSGALTHWAQILSQGISQHAKTAPTDPSIGILVLNALFGATMAARAARDTRVIDQTIELLSGYIHPQT